MRGYRSALLALATALTIGLFTQLLGCERPTVVVSDPGGPQVAVRDLVQAMSARDPQAVQACFIADTPEQTRYVAAIVDLMNASRKLGDAALKKLGKEDAKQLVGPAGPNDDHFRRFVDGKQQVEGDSATLTASTGETLRLRKVSGQWKIIAGSDTDSASMEKAIAYCAHIAGALTNTANAIESGQIKDLDSAKKQISQTAFSTPTP